jgi:parallel beta-helix repeat protein
MSWTRSLRRWLMLTPLMLAILACGQTTGIPTPTSLFSTLQVDSGTEAAPGPASTQALDPAQPLVSELHLNPGDDLAQAFAQAAPDATLTLAAGTYTLDRTVKLEHGLQLGGAGLDQTLIVSSGQAALVFDGDGVLDVQGLTLRNTSLEIHRGQFQFSAFHFTVDAGTQNVGFLVSGDARGTIRDSLFDQNNVAGLQVQMNAYVTLENNQFSQNLNGIAFYDHSGGVVRSNQIFKNQSGILIMEQANPLVEGNQIYDNFTGLLVSTTARPTLNTNEMHGNDKDLRTMTPES